MTIQSVKITNLYGNNYEWQLNPDVNILIGPNGTYKSKILELIKLKLKEDTYSINELYKGKVKIELQTKKDVYYTNDNYRVYSNYPHNPEYFDKFIKSIIPHNYEYSEGERCLYNLLVGAYINTYTQQLVYFLDNPENHLHIVWQRNLINWIRELNPTCQIIITTHSPTIFYQGWIEEVTTIDDIKSGKYYDSIAIH